MRKNPNRGSKKGERRGGRAKGTPNKITMAVRLKFEEAFAILQQKPKDPASLVQWARRNPGEFYKLASKLIPLQVVGDPDNPLVFQDVTKLSDAELEQLRALKPGLAESLGLMSNEPRAVVKELVEALGATRPKKAA